VEPKSFPPLENVEPKPLRKNMEKGLVKN